ncbi:MAG: hypothetical protein M1828_000344 [Chrysothrix sp. TS-e1954]|nr:MAG: hypothetical protein M1828_000344 [Chrysothrix sp. TS-e1954]
MEFPKIYNSYFLACIATLGGALFGFDISSLSLIVGIPQYLNYFGNPHGTLQGGIGASLAGGSVIGALIAGPFSNKVGRRDSVFCACIIWLVGTTLQVSTHSVAQLIVGRFVNGICVGITSSQVPVYLAEIARKENRGSLVVVQQLAIEWGIFIMYFLSYGWSFAKGPTTAFRGAWAMQYIPALLLMIGTPFLPRSPRWLAKVGRKEKAIEVLAKIHAKGNREDALVVAEWEEITEALRIERSNNLGWKIFFKNGMWKRTFAGTSVQAWQQLSGANVMTYYVVYVFLMAGLTGNVNLVSSGVQYAIFIIFTMLTFFFIDKTGRRPLLIYGALCMGICFFVVGGVLGTYSVSVPEGVQNNLNVTIRVTGPPSIAVIVFSYLMVAAYATTLAPVAWVYASEVWSLETRASGVALASVANWLFNFAIGFFIPPGFANITWRIFIIFGVLCFAAAAQAFISYPETCGKTLEEIEILFGPEAPQPWKTKKGNSRLDSKIESVLEDARQGRHHSITQTGEVYVAGELSEKGKTELEG